MTKEKLVMTKKEANNENVDNLNNLNDEVNHLCEEINGLKEKIYALDKEKRIDDLTKKLDNLEQYKNTYAGLVKYIEENAINKQKDTWHKEHLIINGLVGLSIICFYALCAWRLLFPLDFHSEPNDSILLIIGGLSVLLIMAVALLFLVKMTKSRRVKVDK